MSSFVESPYASFLRFITAVLNATKVTMMSRITLNLKKCARDRLESTIIRDPGDEQKEGEQPCPRCGSVHRPP